MDRTETGWTAGLRQIGPNSRQERPSRSVLLAVVEIHTLLNLSRRRGPLAQPFHIVYRLNAIPVAEAVRNIAGAW